MMVPMVATVRLPPSNSAYACFWRSMLISSLRELATADKRRARVRLLMLRREATRSAFNFGSWRLASNTRYKASMGARVA